MEATPSQPKKGGIRRYAPFIGAVVVIALVVFAVGQNKSSDTGSKPPADQGAASNEALIKSGPMTPDKAKLLGKTVDFGEKCDTSTGNVKMPTEYAPMCVAAFTGDNGGATSPGVTGDTIKVVAYIGDPAKDPLQSALIKGAGSDVDISLTKQTYNGWVDMYQKYVEMSGRKVALDFYVGTGAPSDPVAAKADAKAIIDKKPFAVFGGPSQTDAFADELTAAKIVCLGCATAAGAKFTSERSPYLWTTGPMPEQASLLTAQMVGSLLNGKKAEWAGDAATRAKTRVFGAVHYDTPAGQQRSAWATFRSEMKKNDVKIASDIQYYLDLARAQENARTTIAKLKAAKVTSVIFYGDPLTPLSLTKEATAQDYHPEWILGPTVYADTAVFGRIYDQEQWKHAFGISLIPARTTKEIAGWYALWVWQFGTPPPSNNAAVISGPPGMFFAGVNLAGPNLTPSTFRDGLFRAGVQGGNALAPTNSRGHHGIWSGTAEDLGGSDDVTLVWWNATAKGEDEIGNAGTGLYEYVSGGKRYLPGTWPTTDPGLFDSSKSVTIYTTIPANLQPPSYPSPATKK